MYKVAIIVDNPLRDLDGLALVAWCLAKKGIESYLVPMYEQIPAILSICPDFVLTNYLRESNKHLVKAYSDSGITVGVLDTEGGVFTDIDAKFTNYVKNSWPENVDKYFVWGAKQYESLLKNKVFPEHKVVITGCPRYDYCVEPFKDTLSQNRHYSIPYILVNTAFPVIFPKFQTAEEEIITLKSVGHSDNEIREMIRQAYHIWAEIIHLIAEISKHYKRLNIVVRPHPFEDKNIYQYALNDLSNVEVIQQGTSLSWIKHAKLVLHRNCSTAIESCFMGVEPVSIEWPSANYYDGRLPREVSHQAATKEELFRYIDSSLNGNNIEPTQKLLDVRNKHIKDWFYRIDGMAYHRVADSILETIENKKITVDRKKLEKWVTSSFSLKLKSAVKKLLGSDLYTHLKNSRNKIMRLNEPNSNKKHLEKSYSFSEIEELINNIEKVVRFNECRHTSSYDQFPTKIKALQFGKSVKLSS